MKKTEYKAGPTRFENLRPGSKFRIIAEPSRHIRKSNDTGVYVKSRNGFFSTPVDDETVGVVLMPQDIVLPLSRGDLN
ncbi:hypothetical protein [Xanthomonas phage DES1]|nr:hypothetical protein [Xanthomonas phage DES1]